MWQGGNVIMPLALYFHPLASFCWKVLIALYENETLFEPHLIDLGDPASREELTRLWPFARFPVLRDRKRDRIVPESSIIIEYLAQHFPGKVNLLPADPDRAIETRLQDRFYDVYVHEPMQKIVGDELRPAGRNDPHGVELARELIETAYGVIEGNMSGRSWAAGDTFGMADCAAAPALHYANRVVPFGETRKNTAAYLLRLEERPSFKRVLMEAQPYFHLFPG
jgi:glutathione S-transferase